MLVGCCRRMGLLESVGMPFWIRSSYESIILKSLSLSHGSDSRPLNFDVLVTSLRHIRFEEGHRAVCFN